MTLPDDASFLTQLHTVWAEYARLQSAERRIEDARTEQEAEERARYRRHMLEYEKSYPLSLATQQLLQQQAMVDQGFGQPLPHPTPKPWREERADRILALVAAYLEANR